MDSVFALGALRISSELLERTTDHSWRLHFSGSNALTYRLVIFLKSFRIIQDHSGSSSIFHHLFKSRWVTHKFIAAYWNQLKRIVGSVRVKQDRSGSFRIVPWSSDMFQRWFLGRWEIHGLGCVLKLVTVHFLGSIRIVHDPKDCSFSWRIHRAIAYGTFLQHA